MNMQKLMMEAQKMQQQLQKDYKEMEKMEFEGKSSLVKVIMNGKYEVKGVNLELSEFNFEDKEMLEDMIMLAINDAVNKVEQEKNKKMGKYGQGFSGLM